MRVRTLLVLVALAVACAATAASARNATVKATPAGGAKSEARLLIAEKFKRLRALQRQMQTIKREIGTLAGAKPDAESAAAAAAGASFKLWKRRVQRRLHRLTEKVARLELRVATANSHASTSTAFNADVAGATAVDADAPTVASRPPLVATTTRPPANVTRSERLNPGAQGAACAGNSDCRPGHCCHHQAANASACHRHAYTEGASCGDSCFCAGRLQCFRQSTPTQVAFCKQAASDDAARGVYLNEPRTTLSASAAASSPSMVISALRAHL